MKLCVRLRIRIQFVKTCINRGLAPTHVNMTRYHNLNLFHNTLKKVKNDNKNTH